MREPSANPLNSGKLRFYLDGRFVLELTHAAGSSNTSSRWIQSKGKLWTPSCTASASTSMQVGLGQQAIQTAEDTCPVINKVTPLGMLNSSGSLNSPFMLSISRRVRLMYLCWLSRKQLRRAARNFSIDVGALYQSALSRNSPVSCVTRLDRILKEKSSGRRRCALNGIWKELFNSSARPAHQDNCNSSPTCSLSSDYSAETESKVNRSLLLDALTKPKIRDCLESGEAEASLSLPPPKMNTGKRAVDGGGDVRRCNSNKYSGCPEDMHRAGDGGVTTNSKCDVPMSSILPLPEWYLDPSKAEVPISEMIGYPRPYFPPTVNTTINHINRKPNEGNNPVPQTSWSSKRVRLKQDEFLKKTSAKETSSTLLRTGVEHIDKPSTSWPPWCKVEETEGPSQDGITTEHGITHSETSAADSTTKGRSSKRFGNYGRGPAVSDAIRTFVIGDIVNLGGDVKSRYVPRGVYAEVASRYKIDVSTTTRWWLRHCANIEIMMNKQSEKSQSCTSVPLIKFEKNRLHGLHLDTSSANVKSHNMQWPSPTNSLPVVPPLASATNCEVRPMSEPLWAGISSGPKEYNETKSYSISKRIFSVVPDNGVDPLIDGPLDLRVNSKRMKTEENVVSKPIPAVVVSESNRQQSSLDSWSLNVRNTNLTERLSRSPLDFSSSNYTKRPLSNENQSEDKSQLQQMGEISLIPEELLVRCPSQTSSSSPCDTLLKSPVRPTKSLFQSSPTGAPNTTTMNYTHSSTPTEQLSLSSTSVQEFPMLNSALNQHEEQFKSLFSSRYSEPTSSTPNSSTQSKEIPSQEHASANDVKSRTGEVKELDSSMYMNCVTKPISNDYSTLRVPPISQIHPEYPSLPGHTHPHPPPLGLAPWPYTPCPLMAYGPTLVNSYYYCCCFLPGCRFHYLYNVDGRPLEPGEPAPASMLADGYAKYCPHPDVPPTEHVGQLRKHWANWPSTGCPERIPSATEGVTLHLDVAASCKREDKSSSQAEQETSQQSAESSGSMLKDLLLKPSRTTPDKSLSLISSAKNCTVRDKVTKVNSKQLPVGVKLEIASPNHLTSGENQYYNLRSSSPSENGDVDSEMKRNKINVASSTPVHVFCNGPSPIAHEEESILLTSVKRDGFWDGHSFQKPPCQPGHYPFQISSVETEES